MKAKNASNYNFSYIIDSFGMLDIRSTNSTTKIEMQIKLVKSIKKNISIANVRMWYNLRGATDDISYVQRAQPTL